MASYTGGSPPMSPYVMSPGGGSPSNRSPPLGRSYDSVTSFEGGAFRDEFYKNRSSRKIDSRRLFSSEYDFPKTFSLTEFSGKTYFYAIGSRSFNAGFDEKNLELQEKNIELERRVLDLEDSLKAKEELVKARTEAVTLLSADLSQKGRATLDQLEDTRTEMRSMQVR